MGNRNAEVGDILLKHRSDALAIAQGKSNGKDIGTSAAEAQADIEALIKDAVREARIDELERYPHPKADDDTFVDELSYQYRVKRLAQLQAREEKRK